MRTLPLFALALLITTFASGGLEIMAQESITVTIVGTLRSGVVAIGGETTGATITAKGITWELDFDKNAALEAAAKKLNGKQVTVTGTLARKAGIEIKERWIVTVTSLK